MDFGGLWPHPSSPPWKSKALWKKMRPKILITSWSASFQRGIPHAEGVLSAPKREAVTRYKGIQRKYKGNTKELQRETLRDAFCVRDASLEGRRSASNQYFWSHVFQSALDFHAGDDESGHSLPKSIAAPQDLFVRIDFSIYGIDSCFVQF